MNKNITKLIEEKYNIRINNIKEAPRQYVAQTWFIDSNMGEYFVKIVDKKLFIPEIIESLPVLYAMQKSGIERINYPIVTQDSKLYIYENDVLIVLFNKINAVQTYEYSEKALGELLAQIHLNTNKVDVKIPQENYIFPYKNEFKEMFEGVLNGSLVTDPILKETQEFLKYHEERSRRQYAMLNKIQDEMLKLNLPKVITHGDAGGNTLMKEPDDIYIIDWDGILLAPAERDMWVPGPDFLVGYKNIRTDFEVNQTSIAFYTLKYYFSSYTHYLIEIVSDKDVLHRKKHMNELKTELLQGWLVKYLKKINAFEFQ